MTFTEWFIVFLIIQVIHFLGTWKLYIKAGKKAWEAAIPVYNAIVLMQIINRPKWWVILLFIPIVNLLMFPIIWIETCRSFGFNQRKDTLLAVFSLGLYIYYINYIAESNYVENRSLQPRTPLGEWVSSIAFAIIAATLVHTYFMQPYTIPTSSLEKTLLVGDYLFVSKFHYGARVPMTTVSAPMVHDTIPALPIPFTGINLTPSFKSFLSNSKNQDSWLNKLSLPYMRLPGFQKIKRNEIVVFSWPADSLASMWGDTSGKHTYKPIDKRTNYVKRCVGIPGDSLEVRDGYVFINGKRTVLPDRAKPQWYFVVNTEGEKFTQNEIVKYHINTKEARVFNDGRYLLNFTDDEAKEMAKNPKVKSIEKHLQPKGFYDKTVFPHDPRYAWSSDNFGPIYIPKQGNTVELNAATIPFYEQIIRRYENNDLTIFGDDIYINGEKTNSYTFKQDYYWMMGDNRQNSLDARNWGYVPFDHVVGKPVMIWLSWDANAPNFIAKLKSIRWDRMFTTVGGSGEPTSFLLPIIILIIGYLLFDRWWKKNKVLNIQISHNSEFEFASVSSRIQAAVIDGFILMILIYSSSQIFALFDSVNNTIKIITFIFIFFLYDPILTSSRGATIGHTISNISVRKQDKLDSYISLPLAIVRFFIKFILGWLSLTTISGNEKRKAIHDFIANSVVIKNKK